MTSARLAMLLLLAAGAAPMLPAIAQASPNILLISADDLGYGDLGVYGHTTLRTPNLDRLASQGLRLTSYYAPSPLCSPSRASLLTGRIHFRTGIESWIPPDTDIQLGPDEITLATLLQQRGYATFLGGKWHLNGGLDIATHTQPQDHGFDEWIALHAWAKPHHRNPFNFFKNGTPLGEVKGYPAQVVVDEAIEWIDRQDASTPLFIYLALVEPHGTLANPDSFNERYSQFTRGEPDPIPNMGSIPENLEARGPGEYYANVTHMDHQIGRILSHLDYTGIADETLVIFTSDNGPVTTEWRHWWEVNLYGSTGGLRGRKADLYEGGIRVPAIIRWRGHVPEGTESDAAVVGYDLLPTLASIAGFDVPGDRPIDGEDFSALLRDEPFERARPIYWEFEDDQGFHFALRDGEWKLLADRAFERLELYNLERDRFEVVDRAAEQPAILQRLVAMLRSIAADVASDPLRRVGNAQTP